jgi:ABC-type uncharacterized transport system YnjBCD ATPase subunit
MNSFDMYAALQNEAREVAELAAALENKGESELAESMLVRLERISNARIALTARVLSNPKALAKLHACAAVSR